MLTASSIDQAMLASTDIGNVGTEHVSRTPHPVYIVREILADLDLA